MSLPGHSQDAVAGAARPGASGGALQRQAAVLRQPWQARALNTGWRSPWVPPVVQSLSVLLLLAWWPGQWRLALGVLGLLWLAWAWWLHAEGLFRQNTPALARLVPGQARALRLQLVVGGAVVAVAAVLVLSATLGPVRPWWWIVLPLVVLMAWLVREPWLWLLLVLAGPWVPLHAWAAEAAAAAPGLKLLALLAAAALTAAAIGQGGALHRWHGARCRTALPPSAGRRDGPARPGVARSGPVRLVMAFFGWPRALWRRRVLARGAQAPLMARLDLGLGTGGQWAEVAWSAALLFGGLAITLAVIVWRDPTVDLRGGADLARFGLCVGAFSVVASLLHERLGRLWARRREQALLLLLPGHPAGDFSALEQRWRREYLLAWLAATVLVLGVGAAGSPGSLDYAAACAALCLPLAWLAQHQHRRLQQRPALAALLLAPWFAALAAWPVQLMGVPAWASLALGAAAYATLARQRRGQRLVLPLGRRSGG